jgi:spore photoproduct lyase
MIRFEKQKGKFIKHCPCTPDVISCGYYNINLHTGCPYCCSYCILQAYLETTEPIFFTNLEDMEKELTGISHTQKHLRIGTGELSDSLALDPQTHYSHKILSIFEKFPHIVFEFKTKSTHVEDLLNYGKKLKNIVVSWSLNPREVVEREELLTPDLFSRLKAIEKAQNHGYKIGIHFDPIVIFDGWQTAYLELIKEISKIIDPERIAWWSLGALRFPYSLREHIFKYRDSRLFEGELIKGHDGKYRYFKPLRLELFRYMKQKIQEHISKEVPLYLCMEDKEVWEEVFPEIPPDEDDVNKYLYESALK